MLEVVREKGPPALQFFREMLQSMILTFRIMRRKLLLWSKLKSMFQLYRVHASLLQFCSKTQKIKFQLEKNAGMCECVVLLFSKDPGECHETSKNIRKELFQVPIWVAQMRRCSGMVDLASYISLLRIPSTKTASWRGVRNLHPTMTASYSPES